MLSRFVIVFLPRSKILNFVAEVISESKKIKSASASTFLPSLCQEVMGLCAMNLIFWMLNFNPDFSFSSFTLIKMFFSSCLLFPLEWYHLHTQGCYFSWQSWFQVVVHPAQHFVTACSPVDCSPPGSSVHGISQILEWVAISYSRGSSWVRDWTHIPWIGRQILYQWVIRETHP